MVRALPGDYDRNGLLGVAGGVAGAAASAGWTAFAAMVVSLLAAIGGAMWGTRRAAMRVAGA